MNDFLNCYEKLNIDYSNLKYFFNMIESISKEPGVVSREKTMKIALSFLKDRLESLNDYYNLLAASIEEDDIGQRDSNITKNLQSLKNAVHRLNLVSDLQYDKTREKEIKDNSSEIIKTIDNLLEIIKTDNTEERERTIVDSANTIYNCIINNTVLIYSPYIDEYKEKKIKANLDKLDKIDFNPKPGVIIRKSAILQNAFNIEETQELNEIYYMNFSLPGNDDKIKNINTFGFIRWNEDGQLYRIVKKGIQHNDTDILTVECEHVITTLSNDVMLGSITYGGGSVKTSDVINYILSFQKTKNWVLAGCDFDRKFSYTWNYETLLGALYSVPKDFCEDYMWDYDTTTYPWKLYLRKLKKENKPEFYIRAKRNLIGSESNADYTGIVTRVYALGTEDEDGKYLDITSVNNGIPYVQASFDIIEKYGLIETVLIDRRFTDPESLKSYAESYMRNTIEPAVSRSFDVIDLYPITNTDIDNAHVGALARLVGDGTNVFITKTTRVHDQIGNLNIELSTKPTTLVDQFVSLSATVNDNNKY